MSFALTQDIVGFKISFFCIAGPISLLFHIKSIEDNVIATMYQENLDISLIFHLLNSAVFNMKFHL